MHVFLESGAGRRAQRIVTIGLAGGAAIGVLAVAAIYLTAAPVVSAERAYWTVAGPPCPEATQAELDRIGRPLAQVKDFSGARFARISGAVLCSDLTDDIGLMTGVSCQFNAPRALAIWSKGGSALFQMTMGQPATVTVSDDRPPRCVLAAHFDGD